MTNNPSNKLVFVQSLPKKATTGRRPLYNYKDIAEQLRQRPGVWALISKDAPKARSTAIKRGLGTEFQLAQRSAGTKDRVDFYVRFVGHLTNNNVPTVTLEPSFAGRSA